MALSASTVWEVRPTGNTANGGGFVTGATGTDYSQQDSPQVTFNGTTITASIAAAGATITLSGVTADSTWVGNLLNISSGTGFTVGRYQIISQTGSTVTLDRNVSAGAASAMVGRMGGAVLLLLTAAATMVAGNTVYVKGGGTETFAQNVTITAGTVTLPTRVEGYITTRGDIDTGTYASTHDTKGFLVTTGWPILSTATFVLTGNTYSMMVGLVVTSTKTTGTLFTTSNAGNLYRCKVFSTVAGTQQLHTNGTSGTVRDCDFSNNGAAGTQAIVLAANALMTNCRVTSTLGGGVSVNGAGITIAECVFYDMAATEVAIKGVAANASVSILNNTFDRCAGWCITFPDLAQTTIMSAIDNNQVTNCGTFCENLRVATQAIRALGRRNRIRDTTNLFVGFWSQADFTRSVTTSQSDAAEYTDVTNKNYMLKRAAAGVATLAGGTTTGAFQRVDSVLPTAAQVLNGTGFGDLGTEFTGTVVLPAVTDVKATVTYGPSSSLTGTLAGSGTVHIIGG